MASLAFNKIINLSTLAANPNPKYMQRLQIAQEINSDIYQYYTQNSLAYDKRGKIVTSDYDNISFDTPGKSITSLQINRIGIKSFPQLGAIGFYTRVDTLRSYLLLPIHADVTKLDAPQLTVVQNAGGITFTITAPEDISYMCYRIVMGLGDTVYEYVTYDTALTINPPSTTGTYEIYCIGYVDEGERISADSVHQQVSIAGTGQSDIPANDIYVTAASFNNSGLLELIMSNGDTITASNAPMFKHQRFTATLVPGGWEGSTAPYSQTLQISGIVPTGYAYITSPTASNWAAYCGYGIYMDDPLAADTVTFYATTEKPTTNIDIQILKMGVL